MVGCWEVVYTAGNAQIVRGAVIAATSDTLLVTLLGWMRVIGVA